MIYFFSLVLCIVLFLPFFREVKTESPRRVTTGRADYDRWYEEAAQWYGLDPNVLILQGRQESGFHPEVVAGRIRSRRGAAGIAQFMPHTARRYGLRVSRDRDDRLNPQLSIYAQAQHMRNLINRFRRYDLALAAYNCGENRHSLRQGRIPRISETRNYVRRIALAYSREVGGPSLIPSPYVTLQVCRRKSPKNPGAQTAFAHTPGVIRKTLPKGRREGTHSFLW